MRQLIPGKHYHDYMNEKLKGSNCIAARVQIKAEEVLDDWHFCYRFFSR